jgi:hypothetical protein
MAFASQSTTISSAWNENIAATMITHQPSGDQIQGRDNSKSTSLKFVAAIIFSIAGHSLS